MSLVDELGKEKLANCNIIMPRKKTGPGWTHRWWEKLGVAATDVLEL